MQCSAIQHVLLLRSCRGRLAVLPCLPSSLIIPRRQDHGKLVWHLVRPIGSNYCDQLTIQNLVACWAHVEACRWLSTPMPNMQKWAE